MASILPKQLDEGLRRYYEHKSVRYSNQFAAWIEKNGFHTNDIIREFKQKPQDIAFINFDDDFPTNCSGDNKIEEIFKVLYICYKDPTAFINSPNNFGSLSPFHIIKTMRPFKTCLVDGYFMINFGDNTPFDIIRLTIFYCFILDEFELQSTVKGLNKSIATSTSNEFLQISTRNTIKSPGKYHWKFKMINCDNSCCVAFRLLQNGKYTLICNVEMVKEDIVHIYVDTDKQTVGHHGGLPNISNFQITKLGDDEINDCKLQLVFDDNCSCIEMVEYHNSNWCINRLSHNKQDGVAHIDYARCTNNLIEKLKYYLIALQIQPSMETWNNEYLLFLIYLKQYNKAYQHILKYKKGYDAMALLGKYFYRKKHYEFAYNVLKLLNDEQLKKYNLYFKIARCYNHLIRPDKQSALKYYQLYWDQHQYDTDEKFKKTVLVCIGNMALIHYFDLDDLKTALSLFLQLGDAEIERKKLNGHIGGCYLKEKKYDEALKYYQLHLNKHPDDVWIYYQLYLVYEYQKEYDKAKDCLLRGLNLETTDTGKVQIYANLGVNAYIVGNLEDAIKFTTKALELESSDNLTALMHSNIGKFLYKSGSSKYEESYQYLSKAIKIEPNDVDVIGNYGIILYFMKKFDEAIVYLDKCLLNEKEMIKDPELLPDVLYIYGEILYDKGEYNKSIEKCLKVTNMDKFIDYKDKDKVYYLMSRNYEELSEYETSLQYLSNAKAFSSNKKEEYQQKIVLLQSKLNVLQ